MAAAATMACAIALSGCTNPDAVPSNPTGRRAVSPGGPGEPAAPAPTPAGGQRLAGVRANPEGALAAFAELYVNWSWRTLTARQRVLAAISVGSARAAEQQAAASSGSDRVIRSGQIQNSGRVVAVAPDALRRGYWAIVTLERTSGNTQYRGLPAGYHLTLARVAHVHDGYAVSEWLPQS